MEDEDLICTDCKRRTEVVYDHASGDTICSECGLVLESYCIDERSEWRTFSDSLDDPCRVGKALDPLLSSQPLTTSIASVKGGVAPPVLYNKSSSSKPDRLISAMQTISSMADRLALVETIVDRANEIFKKVIIDTKTTSWKGKKHSDAMCAACLFVACQQESLPRTFKEVCSVVEGGATKKDVGRAKCFIMQHLNEDYSNNINNNDNGVNKKKSGRTATVFVKRFCSNLGMMDNRASRAAIQAAETAEVELDVRRSPVSLAAAAIYIVSRFLEEVKRPTLREVAVATGVAEGTIKSACKDIRPHIGKIVPTWFASEPQLKIAGNYL